jgi:hypothetical protein
MIGFFFRSLIGSSQLRRALGTHFKGIALTDIVTAAALPICELRIPEVHGTKELPSVVRPHVRPHEQHAVPAGAVLFRL